jgi:hypothetical protein
MQIRAFCFCRTLCISCRFLGVTLKEFFEGIDFPRQTKKVKKGRFTALFNYKLRTTFIRSVWAGSVCIVAQNIENQSLKFILK